MEERLTTAPVGHIYDVITNGYGRMYSYNQQLPVADRWAIVAYVKTLQVAGSGSIDDVPEAERVRLEQMEPIMTTATANRLRQQQTAATTDVTVPGGAQ